MIDLSSVINTPTKLLLREYYDNADWSREAASYVRANGIDLKLINAHAGVTAVIPCSFDGAGYFDFDLDGENCFICEVLDEDAATTIDLCATSIANPSRFGTAMGAAPVLGLTNVTNPASWAFGKKLTVHRRPIDWLRTGCDGIVILDHRTAPACIAQKLGDLLAEDEAHARDLLMMLCTPAVDPASILYHRNPGRAAA